MVAAAVCVCVRLLRARVIGVGDRQQEPPFTSRLIRAVAGRGGTGVGNGVGGGRRRRLQEEALSVFVTRA